MPFPEFLNAQLKIDAIPIAIPKLALAESAAEFQAQPTPRLLAHQYRCDSHTNATAASHTNAAANSHTNAAANSHANTAANSQRV